MQIEYSPEDRPREARVGQRERRRIWDRDGGICWLCQQSVIVSHAEIDHVLPLSQGGSDTDDNLRITHWRCNRVRANRSHITSLPVGTAGSQSPPWARRETWSRSAAPQTSLSVTDIVTRPLRERIAELEIENAQLRAAALARAEQAERELEAKKRSRWKFWETW